MSAHRKTRYTKNAPLTDDGKTTINALWKDYTDKVIGEIIERPVEVIKNYRIKNGLSKPRSFRATGYVEPKRKSVSDSPKLEGFNALAQSFLSRKLA